ncbi:transcriptional regulator [Bifidobacterium sp. DSM 109958]|uniref:Transcriptional regulator n=1 Tax=Bifidobacterium moraviense TaxID=2675323 RepID=A0A7Y0HZW8_9BIFI|nr:RNA-binding domain-containing protein [Bifidobacterium sp. DSM 109958]NMN00818.1 transcriptional regulator [Bifidobacterium sp. DSM 109958]
MDREGQHLEFKLDWNDNAKKTAVAFANSGGGTILIGVDDDGHTIGVKDPDSVMLRAMQAIDGGIRPDLARFADIHADVRDGRTVVAVDVKPGTERPYYLSDKGPRPAGVYVRLGAGSIPATEAAILAMIRGSARLSFEESPSVEQDLTFGAAGEAFREAGVAFGPAAMRTLKMTVADGAYTNLGWLLSDQCTAQIKTAVFEGTDKRTFNARAEFSGSLLAQFRAVAEWVGRYNSTRSTFDASLRRVDERDYAPAVVREALLNMVVHRDYSFAGPALVSVFDDRMEFVNFGGLPAGMTERDMMLGTSLQRNPNLAAVLYRLGWVEAYGTGVPRIIDDYRGESEQPRFEISDNAFRLVLPSHNPTARPGGEDAGKAAGIGNMSEPEPATVPGSNRDAAVALVSRPGGATRADVERATGLTRSGAGRLLRELVASGAAVKRGEGRGTRYVAGETR